jgi:hypothetical protein
MNKIKKIKKASGSVWNILFSAGELFKFYLTGDSKKYLKKISLRSIFNQILIEHWERKGANLERKRKYLK